MFFCTQVALWATLYGRRCPTLVTQSGGHWWSNAGQQSHLSGQASQRSQTDFAPWPHPRRYSTEATNIQKVVLGPVRYPPHISLGSVHTPSIYSVYCNQKLPAVCLQVSQWTQQMPIHSFILFWLRGAFNKFVGLASVIGESDIYYYYFHFLLPFPPFSG